MVWPVYTPMKILFVSRRNNQAHYFSKLHDNLPFETSVHIIGSTYFRSIRCWREWLEFDVAGVVRTQLLRRSKKYPKLAKWKFIVKLYGWVVAFKERNRYAKYCALIDDLKPESVGLWNGKKLPTETIVLAARDQGVPVVFFENGLLPGTCSIDQKGVNEESSLPRDPAFYQKYRFESPELAIKPLSPRPPLKSRRKEAELALPERYVFVPFQVPDDTQIVRHSPWIESMEMLFDCVMEAVEASGDCDLKVVFKEHPSWPGHFDRLYDCNNSALFANGNATPDLIRNSLAVITINSTVGLEGVLLGKPVVVLGKACYVIPDLVKIAQDQASLMDGISDIILNDWVPDMHLRAAYLRFLNDVYCIPEKWSEASEAHFLAAANRILGTDEFARALNR